MVIVSLLDRLRNKRRPCRAPRATGTMGCPPRSAGGGLVWRAKFILLDYMTGGDGVTPTMIIAGVGDQMRTSPILMP